MPTDLKSPITAHLTLHTSFAPAITAWRFYLEDQGNSPHTIKAFAHDVQLLATYLPPDKPIGEVSTTDINNYLHWMENSRGVPCSPKTLARRITSVKSFFRWLHQYGVILVDPAEKVLQHSVISPLPQVLSPDEVRLVLDTTNRHRKAQKPDARPHALVTLLLETGIKKTECLGLSPNHIDVEDLQNPYIFVRYASPQHRYKERKIPVSNDWLDSYNEYKAQYPVDDRIFPWSQRRLEYILEDIGEEAGLDKHLSFDMCRWTCALSDWQSGVDHNKIRQKLGISKIQWREIRMKLEQLSTK
jgi:integrase/recombinase XerD